MSHFDWLSSSQPFVPLPTSRGNCFLSDYHNLTPFVFLSVCLSVRTLDCVCLSACLRACLSTCLPPCLFVSISVPIPFRAMWQITLTVTIPNVSFTRKFVLNCRTPLKHSLRSFVAKF